jgi:hypothetical protein
MNDTQVIGLSWFQPEQWERLIEISEDRDALDDSYEDWRKNANNTIQKINALGKHIQRVKIDLDELLHWCEQKNEPVNGASRAEFVAFIMERRNKKALKIRD